MALLLKFRGKLKTFFTSKGKSLSYKIRDLKAQARNVITCLGKVLFLY